jgi:hypothetical protein
MSGRVEHHRTKGPVSTPAGRMVELTNEVLALRRDLTEMEARAQKAEDSLARFTTIGGGGFGVSFGDIPVAQIWADFVMWETILNKGEYRAVFELGTWNGGFSWWLWAQCEAREMLFHTFDSIVPERRLPRDIFTKADVFAEASPLGALFRGWEPCVVFCDNGNKPRELKTFANEISHPESLLVVHDWGTEFMPEDVPDTVEMIHREFCEELGSISRVFRLRRDDA